MNTSDAPAPPTNWQAMYSAMPTPQLVSEAWETTTDTRLRDRIMTVMAERERTGEAVWPTEAESRREREAGLYPDPMSPDFAARIYSKREFYEARAVAAAIANGSEDACTSVAAEKAFELTPVQRIVSRFLHPKTPYMGMLIDHGVGVGKTCTAVTIAEQFLEAAPHKKVIVLAPLALHKNFKNTVFDPSKIKWDADDGQWTSNQCTGTSYLERLDLMTNPDLSQVVYRTDESRRSRYTITGYLAFANWIQRTLSQQLPAGLTDPAAREAAENEILRRLFSDHLIIVDEAHNLRDLAADTAVTAAVAEEGGPPAEGADSDAAENAGGKALNPLLRRIVLNAESMRLVFMTATPMYNDAREIILLLNYLLMNDTKNERAALQIKNHFTADGDLVPGKPQKILEAVARRYVTYMRGENPFTFPLRMRPITATESAADRWPRISASRAPVDFSEQDKAVVNAMPFLFTEPVEGSPPEKLLRESTRRDLAVTTDATTTKKRADAMLDARIQMGNISYPNDTFGLNGWDAHFATQTSYTELKGKRMKIVQFSPKGPLDEIFRGDGLRACAPKMHRILDSVMSAKGICFVYSQHIRAGALPMAVALERAGFQRRMGDGTIQPLLTGVPPVPPICAICSQRAGERHAADHPFRPACYVLLTSDEGISRNFAGIVQQVTNFRDDPEWAPLGGNVKVILGSRVASEGLDLRCIREMHIMDPWYQLNRLEQVIGRAIRFCSHTPLRAVERRMGLPPMALNNCLIYMHALNIPERVLGSAAAGGGSLPAIESVDQYAYRIAIKKIQFVGKVQRLLKKHAWDCNLEFEAIIFAGLPPRRQIDAQGNERRSRGADGVVMDAYSINDQDYTTYCDYQVCRHECAVNIADANLRIDESTYSASDARQQILAKQEVVRHLFDDQVIVPETLIQEIFSDMPWEIASDALMELIDGRRFRLRRPDGVEGFLVKKAGYVVFQPAVVSDLDIPMTLRYARAFQLKRRFMDASLPVLGRAEEYRLVAPVPVTVPALTIAPIAEESVPVTAPATAEGLLSRWQDWLSFVQSGGTRPWPTTVTSAFEWWTFLLRHFADISESRAVALRWWFDKLTYDEQRQILELALNGEATAGGAAGGAAAGGGEPPAITALKETVARDIFRSTEVSGYRVYNPAETALEYYCQRKGEATVSKCTSQIQAIMERRFNELAGGKITIPDSTGPLFGFLAPKKGSLVFKTLDISKTKKGSLTGAECGNTSNLGEHIPRIAALQDIARGADLGGYMLQVEEEWKEATAKGRRDKFTAVHVKDFKHQPMCLYLEFLTRLLDARRVNGKRWFLTAADGAVAGLKGRG